MGAGPEAGGVVDPASIAGLTAWYKADAGTSTTTDGVGVSQWNDQSGNGFNAVQATGANQPLYKAAIQNGLPVLRFDAVNDYMQAAGVNVAQPDTIFLVAKNTLTGGTFSNAFDGNTTRQTIGRWSTDAVAVNCGTTDVVTAQLWGSTLFHQLSLIANGASSLLWFDATSVTLGSNPGTANLNVLNIGTFNTSTSFWSGDIAELLIYNSALSTPNRQAVEGYLRGKWGTP
jgi:hypothetical protein